MSRPPISLAPQRCDKCLRCVRVCRQHAINVSAAFTFIDWDRCDGCGACVKACESGAISARPGRQPSGGATVRAATAAAIATADAAVRAERAAVEADAPSAVPAMEGPAPSRASFTAKWEGWEVAVVLLGVAALYGAQQLVLSSAWWAKVVPLGAKPVMRAGILIVYYAAQLGLLATLGYRKRAGVAEAFGLKRTAVWRAVLGVLALLAASETFVVLYGVFTNRIGWQMPSGPTTDLGAYFGRDTLGLAMTVVMVVLVGPFFEEVVFRGVLQGYLQERIGAWPAIVVAALLFSGYHLSLWEFAPVAVMGVAAGWLAVRHRSLWPAFALHLAFNAIPVFVAFMLPR